MNLSLPKPFISVLIRSYNRLPCVFRIIDICLSQDYDNFEIVVIDQSESVHWEKHEQAFDKLDDKVRLVRSKPLGPSGARNVGVSHCKGDVVLFIDDDDIPTDDNWISCHAMHYADPFCIGVSGRYIHQLNEKNRYRDREKAYRRCLTYSFFLRGRDFTGIDRIKKPVQWLHGSNASIRRSYVIELGGWYPHLFDFEEHSFCFKLQKALKSNEYLMFDPAPKVLRRFDKKGGIERRYQPFSIHIKNHLCYYHWVVSNYFPIRFYGLYPIFMLYAFRFSSRWFLKYSCFTDSFWIQIFGKKYGRYFCILQELVKYPLLMFMFIVGKKPKSNDHLPLQEMA